MVTTQNYFDSILRIDWNKVPDSLKKTRDTLIPDAAKNNWQIYNSDDDVRRVVEKYFGYIGKYVAPSKSGKTVTDVSKQSDKNAKRVSVSDETKREAHALAIELIRSYVQRGDSYEDLKKSYLGKSNDAGSAMIKADKIIVDKVGSVAVNVSFSLRSIFNEIKNAHEGAAPTTKHKRGSKAKTISDLPEPKQVTHIPTATAFIKRYVALRGKVKTRDQILSLVHGLQKAITEQRITKATPAIREIDKMQAELIAMATKMGNSAKVEIDDAALQHYNQIAQGEAVRTSVKLLKSFISLSGKACDKAKAVSLSKRIEKALPAIQHEDPYRTQVEAAKKYLDSYADGSDKTINIPSTSLHGLGNVVAGHTIAGLGMVSTGEGAIIRLLREEGVNNLSDSSLKKAFRKTALPSLCLEIAHLLIRRKELTMEKLAAKKKTAQRSELGGVNGTGRISDIDILEMQLQRNAKSKNGLGSVSENEQKSMKPVNQNVSSSASVSTTGQIMSAAALKTMKFETIGLTGKWKELIGDPAPGFSMMVYGLPKQGKSTFCLQFANDIAKHGEVLYCALEEGFGATLTEKLNRLGINANALQFSNSIPTDLSRFRFVFIDSVSEAGLDADRLRELRKANPKTAFILIYHSTKGGNFRGSNTDAHDVDIISEVKNGTVEARGRYAPQSNLAIV